MTENLEDSKENLNNLDNFIAENMLNAENSGIESKNKKKKGGKKNFTVQVRSGKTWLIVADELTGNEDTFQIANFSAKITKEVQADNETTWIIFIENLKKSVAINARAIANFYEFALVVAGLPSIRGYKAIYNADKKQVHDIFIEYLFKTSEIKHLRKLESYGDEGSYFCFSNCIVDNAGKEHKGEEKGLIMPDLGARQPVFDAARRIDLKELNHNFAAMYGGESWKLLGFAGASVCSVPIFKRFGGFPLLFLYGTRGTGKSTLAEVLSALTGLNSERAIIQSGSTRKYVERELSNYSSMLVFLNEYDSKKNPLLCSIFDREGYGRAQKSNDSATNYSEIRACVGIIATQNVVGNKSEDVLSRIIRYETRQQELTIEQIGSEKTLITQARKNELSAYVAIAYARQAEIVSLAENYFNDKAYCRLERRAVMVHSIARAAYEVVFGEKVNEDEFIQAIQGAQEQASEQDKTIEFLNAAISLVQSEPTKHGDYAWIEGNIFYFSLKRLYFQAKRFLRQGDFSAIDEKTLRLGLERLGLESKNKKNGINQLRCYAYAIND